MTAQKYLLTVFGSYNDASSSFPTPEGLINEASASYGSFGVS